MDDNVYHYSHDLMETLVDTIPRLVKSKESVIDFFRNCGVPENMLHAHRQKLRVDKASVKIYPLAREILKEINEGGDSLLGARRKLIQRVVEWEDFSTCWENNRRAAIGYVATIRDMVNKKDAFTRMDLERARERKQHVKAMQEAADQTVARRLQRTRIKSDLLELFRAENARKRGTDFENVLNRLFSLDGVSVREQFTVNEDFGTFEQIDGLIAVDQHLYLVELKWWKEPLGPGDVSQHIVRVMTRADARGLFISQSTFTAAAKNSCKTALAHRVITLAELGEIMYLLETDYPIRDWVNAKVTAAIADREPLHRYGVEFH